MVLPLGRRGTATQTTRRWPTANLARRQSFRQASPVAYPGQREGSRQGDDRSRRRVFARIVDQVVEDAFDQRCVEPDLRQVTREIQLDAMAGERRLRGLECAAHDLLERMPFATQRDLAAFVARARASPMAGGSGAYGGSSVFAIIVGLAK